MEDIASNLVTPASSNALTLKLSSLFSPLDQFQVQKARAKYLQGDFFVLMLRTLALAGDHQPRRQMGKPHRTARLLHMLSPRSARAKDINPQIIRLYLYINIGFGFRQNLHQGK